MILYHFTSVAHLPDIIRTGRLLLCESNISRKRRMAGPGVVWLTKTDDPLRCGLDHDPSLQGLKDYAVIDKTRIRFTLDLPKVAVTRYTDWAKSQGIDRHWLAHILASGGARSWYVSTRPLGMQCWSTVEDLHENRTIWVAPPQGTVRSLNEVSL